MWCDNCCLLLPLRAGAMIWAAVIFLYSLAGALILFIYGKFLFFVYPEWLIFGGIAMAVAALALTNVFALSNRSYVWTRVCASLWPIVIIISAIRATLMIVELQRGKDKITWECENGQIWPSNLPYDLTGATLPAAFCTPGEASLIGLFIIFLLGDVLFQLYMFFLTWRFQKRLEHYNEMKTLEGGYFA